MTTAAWLSRILDTKRVEIDSLAHRLDAIGPKHEQALLDPSSLRRTAGALQVWTEIKPRSPSAGLLSTKLTPVERAHVYAMRGASVISVLTDATYFGGSFDTLRDVAASVSIPCLCKEFVLDDVQIEAASRAGARLVLLIARIVDAPTLASLVHAARGRGIEPLVEVVDEAELDRALSAGATLIGVNARDLDTLEMDAERARRVVDAVPPERVVVYLSGVKTGDQVRQLSRHSRVDGVLAGEALMRQDDPTVALDDLIQGARGT